MPINLDEYTFDKLESDLEAILRLQSILLQAAEGQRVGEIATEYKQLRSALLQDNTYKEVTPKFLRRYRDLESMWPAFKSFSAQWEPRRQEIREQFEPLFAEAERLELFNSMASSSQFAPKNAIYDSSAWNGATQPQERLAAIKSLMPIARNAIEQLISTLDVPNHNGGPQLDETEEAISQLRQLHIALGKILEAADEGKLWESLNEGLATETASYARRAAKALRDDPIPYALSAAVLAILTACGIPGIGGYLAGVALNMRKKQN
jgi:hypothetical protein